MRRLLLGLCLFLVACGGDRATPVPGGLASPDAGVALVEQAVALLLDRYVEPLDSAMLYAAAYRGAADVAQALGGKPQGQPPISAATPAAMPRSSGRHTSVSPGCRKSAVTGPRWPTARSGR